MDISTSLTSPKLLPQAGVLSCLLCRNDHSSLQINHPSILSGGVLWLYSWSTLQIREAYKTLQLTRKKFEADKKPVSGRQKSLFISAYTINCHFWARGLNTCLLNEWVLKVKREPVFGCILFLECVQVANFWSLFVRISCPHELSIDL